MTATMSTPIQGVARINPDCHESFDRSAYSIWLTPRNERKAPSKICHSLPFSAMFLISNRRLASAHPQQLQAVTSATTTSLVGTSDRLHEELNALAGEKAQANGWPKSPQRLAAELRRIASQLAIQGLFVHSSRTHCGRVLSISRDCKADDPAD